MAGPCLNYFSFVGLTGVQFTTTTTISIDSGDFLLAEICPRGFEAIYWLEYILQ